MRRPIITLSIVTLLIGLLMVTAACSSAEGVAPLSAQHRFQIATTTSLYDTGLWALLEPKFEDRYDVEMDILYAGTGKALEYGSRGDVDAVVVHAKSSEDKFIADGYGVQRYPFAYNYFVIVGPASDPAGIKGMSPEDAFKKLMEQGKANPGSVKFASRGDNSGTHTKEKAIWTAAGYAYADVQASGEWYIEAGSGMGPTLVLANEKSAYTISDIGTFLAFKKDLGLVTVVDEGAILLNIYSVIAVNPDTIASVDKEMAVNLIKFLISDEIQDTIGKYGAKEYGQSLFSACKGATVCE